MGAFERLLTHAPNRAATIDVDSLLADSSDSDSDADIAAVKDDASGTDGDAEHGDDLMTRMGKRLLGLVPERAAPTDDSETDGNVDGDDLMTRMRKRMIRMNQADDAAE
jgi:hypothetical protein